MYLLTLELAPPLIMKLHIKIPQTTGTHKVNKPIPHITVILNSSYRYLEVARQVQKVISVL
jgi:hypothetical protein